MLTNLVPRTPVTTTRYTREFTDDEGSGYTFPCDKAGVIQWSDMPDIAEIQKENYARALTEKERFVEAYDKVIKREDVYMEPAHGTCTCGTDVSLVNEYQGACECPNCGQWYNLFGQELLPPEAWEG